QSDKRDGAREYRRTSRRLKELQSRDLSLAQALVESTLSAYRAGKLGFAELVLARKTLADLTVQEIQLRGNKILAHLRCLKACEEGAARCFGFSFCVVPSRSPPRSGEGSSARNRRAGSKSRAASSRGKGPPASSLRAFRGG